MKDELFHVLISRNLTWNLPDPFQAYKEWVRVLKRKGLLLIFDANWYHYLRDDEKKKAYDEDRKNVQMKGYDDYNIGDNFDKMEKIAQCLPMTDYKRPMWDQNILKEYGMTCIQIVDDIGAVVYSEKEKLNYSSTPMFLIRAKK